MTIFNCAAASKVRTSIDVVSAALLILPLAILRVLLDILEWHFLTSIRARPIPMMRVRVARVLLPRVCCCAPSLRIG
jgi:hypothetical protein